MLKWNVFDHIRDAKWHIGSIEYLQRWQYEKTRHCPKRKLSSSLKTRKTGTSASLRMCHLQTLKMTSEKVYFQTIKQT